MGNGNGEDANDDGERFVAKLANDIAPYFCGRPTDEREQRGGSEIKRIGSAARDPIGPDADEQ